MAKEDKTPPATPEEQLAEMQAKINALEAAAEKGSTESVAAKKPAVAKLSGKEFEVDGAKYRARFPSFSLNGVTYTEADLLESPTLQAELVKGGYKVIEKV